MRRVTPLKSCFTIVTLYTVNAIYTSTLLNAMSVTSMDNVITRIRGVKGIDTKKVQHDVTYEAIRTIDKQEMLLLHENLLREVVMEDEFIDSMTGRGNIDQRKENMTWKGQARTGVVRKDRMLMEHQEKLVQESKWKEKDNKKGDDRRLVFLVTTPSNVLQKKATAVVPVQVVTAGQSFLGDRSLTPLSSQSSLFSVSIVNNEINTKEEEPQSEVDVSLGNEFLDKEQMSVTNERTNSKLRLSSLTNENEWMNEMRKKKKDRTMDDRVNSKSKKSNERERRVNDETRSDVKESNLVGRRNERISSSFKRKKRITNDNLTIVGLTNNDGNHANNRSKEVTESNESMTNKTVTNLEVTRKGNTNKKSNGHGNDGGAKHSTTKIVVASIFIPIGFFMCVAGLIGVCIDKCHECKQRRKRNKRKRRIKLEKERQMKINGVQYDKTKPDIVGQVKEERVGQKRDLDVKDVEKGFSPSEREEIEKMKKGKKKDLSTIYPEVEPIQ